MSRLQYALAVVIAGELAIGGALFVRQRSRPAVPVGELSYVDALLAGQLRDMVRKCRSPDDWARLGEAYLSYGYFSESEACYRLASEQAPTF